MNTTNQHREIWRIRKVSDATGLPRSTIYALAADGRFPKPIKLSTRASGWDSQAVQSWINEKLAEDEA